MWVNTREFQRTGLKWLKTGVYDSSPPGTSSYVEFWKEEQRRCLQGYEVGGRRITGYHYHYLNFSPIIRVMAEEGMDGGLVDTRSESLPDFHDGDYEFFWLVNIARYGITGQALKELGLEMVPTHIAGGRHMVVLKARRKGYSYKCASMLSRNYYHLRQTKNFVFADIKEYLQGGDGILTKCWDMLAHMDTHTAFRQPRLLDQPLLKQCGYLEDVNGANVPKGRRNIISGVALKGDFDKVRGKAGELLLFEEAGKLPGLLRAWEIALPTVRQGNKTLGTMIAFGTGGSEGADFAGMEDLFYSPDAYECLPIDNMWDDGASGMNCGLFIPIYKNLEGFIDEHGNSDIEAAKAFELTMRENRKTAKDPRAISIYSAEHPFSPQEAMLSTGVSAFDLAALGKQYNRVKSQKLDSGLTYGSIITPAPGQTKFVLQDGVPITRFPHAAGDDLSGGTYILEAPVRNGDMVPDNMYIGCADPYTHDDSVSRESLGVCYILKRSSGISGTFPGCIVAAYIGRPSTVDEWNEQVMRLCDHYNAKLGFESNAGTLIQYYRTKKRMHRLLLKPEFDSERRPSATGGAGLYGLNMDSDNIMHGELYLRDWMNETLWVNEQGVPTTRLQTIVEPALLDELRKYRSKGNFDRVRALMVGMFYLRELVYQRREVKADRRHPAEDFFDKDIFQ